MAIGDAATPPYPAEGPGTLAQAIHDLDVRFHDLCSGLVGLRTLAGDGDLQRDAETEYRYLPLAIKWVADRL